MLLPWFQCLDTLSLFSSVEDKKRSGGDSPNGMPLLHKSRTKMNHRKVFDDFDGIAQLVEQVAVNHPVVGSSPSAVAFNKNTVRWSIVRTNQDKSSFIN